MTSRWPTTPRSVCVIGAGIAGLVAVRALRDAGHRVHAFESRQEIGGLWNDGYDSLHLITAKNLCGLEGFPMPERYALFPHRDEILDYFNRFADTFDLRRLITFGTRVTSTVPRGPAGINGWTVTTDDGRTEDYDVVVLGNGHLTDPIMPELPGTFTGRYFHAHDYRGVADFRGDRVLVLGAGNSGCDIAVDAVHSRHRADIVIRKGLVFQPKTLLGRGRTELPGRFLPPFLRERMMRAALRVAFGTSDDYPGLPAPATRNIDKNPGVVNTQVLHWIHHGRLTVRPGIRSVDGDLVTFEDGTSGHFDTIVAATGYRTTLPFLADEVMGWAGDHPLRHAAGTVFPDLANLYVIGLVGPQGAQWPVYERQMRTVLRLMALQERQADPIAGDLADLESPWEEVNMLRWEWNRRVDRFERDLARLERRKADAGRRRVAVGAA